MGAVHRRGARARDARGGRPAGRRRHPAARARRARRLPVRDPQGREAAAAAGLCHARSASRGSASTSSAAPSSTAPRSRCACARACASGSWSCEEGAGPARPRVRAACSLRLDARGPGAAPAGADARGDDSLFGFSDGSPIFPYEGSRRCRRARAARAAAPAPRSGASRCAGRRWSRSEPPPVGPPRYDWSAVRRARRRAARAGDRASADAARGPGLGPERGLQRDLPAGGRAPRRLGPFVPRRRGPLPRRGCDRDLERAEPGDNWAGGRRTRGLRAPVRAARCGAPPGRCRATPILSAARRSRSSRRRRRGSEAITEWLGALLAAARDAGIALRDPRVAIAVHPYRGPQRARRATDPGRPLRRDARLRAHDDRGRGPGAVRPAACGLPRPGSRQRPSTAGRRDHLRAPSGEGAGPHDPRAAATPPMWPRSSIYTLVDRPPSGSSPARGGLRDRRPWAGLHAEAGLLRAGRALPGTRTRTAAQPAESRRAGDYPGAKEMSDAPLVSVVIPTHRRETRLSFALDALAAQTLPLDRFEVVAVRSPDAGPRTTPPGGLRRQLPRQPGGEHLRAAQHRLACGRGAARRVHRRRLPAGARLARAHARRRGGPCAARRAATASSSAAPSPIPTRATSLRDRPHDPRDRPRPLVPHLQHRLPARAARAARRLRRGARLPLRGHRPRPARARRRGGGGVRRRGGRLARRPRALLRAGGRGRRPACRASRRCSPAGPSQRDELYLRTFVSEEHAKVVLALAGALLWRRSRAAGRARRLPLRDGPGRQAPAQPEPAQPDRGLPARCGHRRRGHARLGRGRRPRLRSSAASRELVL